MAAPMLTRREAIASTGAAALLFALPGCARQAPVQSAGAYDPADHMPLVESIGERLLRRQPEQATSLGIDTGEFAALRSQLADRSPAGQARMANTLRADLARVEAVDLAPLDIDARTHFEVIRSAYRVALDGFALPYGDVAVGGWRNAPYVVIQNVGAYLDVPRFLDSEHPVNDAADAAAYLARLDSFADQLDGELARMRAAAAHGLIPPGFLIDKALPQMRAAHANAENPEGSLVTSLAGRTESIPGDWAARAHAIASQQVAPALARQIAEMERQRPLATDDPGMGARPDGDAFYRWALRAATTTTLTPDEIHRMGREQVQEIQAEMDTILRGVGYSEGTVGERMTALGSDPDYLFPNTDEGRQDLLAFLDERLAMIRAEMPNAFDTLVRGNVEIRRLPPEEEPGAPGAYGGPGSIDGTIPGKFWINLRDTAIHPRYNLPSLVHHEAIPGHVWQGEYANRLPLIRNLLSFSAYTEGWALYGEQMADELGVYDGDPVYKLGYLQSIAFRACRLVVDTGLHAKGWSRDQAIRWFAETNGSPVEEVAGEVDRYCSWPGQACGYKIGHSMINRLRDQVRGALGEAYDFKEFNDLMVTGGYMPLDVLGRNVEAYIAGKTG